MELQPREVVQTILRYIISVPILFDPEGLSTNPEQAGMMVNFHNVESILASHGDYWEAERHRNTCRRVCKSWDAYLRLFEHRLVYLHDVFGTRTVPVESLSKALFIAPIDRAQRFFSPLDKYVFFSTLRQLQKPTRIQTLFFPSDILSVDDVSILAQWAPQLRTTVSEYGLAGSSYNFSYIVHGSIYLGTNSSLEALKSLPSTLRSLSIKLNTDGGGARRFNETTLDPGPLSSLEFLSLTVSGPFDPAPFLRTLLSTFGTRVTTLQMLTSLFKFGVDDLLDLCPQVQVLHMNVYAHYELGRPDAPRQLHTLVVSLPVVHLKRPATYKGHLVWPGWPQIIRVISADSWDDLNQRPIGNLIRWGYYWEESPVRIEDRDGVSLQTWRRANGAIY